MDKQTFLAEIRATHELLAAAIAGVPDDGWAEPVEGLDGWTRADALAHVGWWSDHSARVIAALRDGRAPYEQDPDVDIDARNRAILEEWRGREPAEVRDFEADAYARLVAAVEAASEEELFEPHRFGWITDETLAEAVGWDSSDHYREHLPHLTA